MTIWMKFGGFLLLGLGLAACSLGTAQTASQPIDSGAIEDRPANDESRQSVTLGADMTQIHTDAILGIAITYPAGWYVEGTAGRRPRWTVGVGTSVGTAGNARDSLSDGRWRWWRCARDHH